jgi:hypothetical protein
VLAGTAVTLLTAYVVQKLNENNQTKNLKFELDFNIQKLESWIAEIVRYRNAVNGDALNTYFGHFDLSRVVAVTTYNLLQSGHLYKLMHRDDFSKLLVIFQELSPAGEQYLNNQINQAKQTFTSCMENPALNLWSTTHKAQAVAIVDFWETKFKQHKVDLERIRNNLR